MEDSIQKIVAYLEKNHELVPVVEDAIAAYEAKRQPSVLSKEQMEELELRKVQHLAGQGKSWSMKEVEQYLADLRGA